MWVYNILFQVTNTFIFIILIMIVIIIISLHMLIWYHVFLFNTNNLSDPEMEP